MELYLKDDRTYHFSDDPLALATTLGQQDQPAYFLKVEGNIQTRFIVENIHKR
jgi:hypothetical protein